MNTGKDLTSVASPGVVAGDPELFAFFRGVGVFRGVFVESSVRLFRRSGVAVVEKLSTSSSAGLRTGVGRDFWDVLRVSGMVRGRREVEEGNAAY